MSPCSQRAGGEEKLSLTFLVRAVKDLVVLDETHIRLALDVDQKRYEPADVDEQLYVITCLSCDRT